MHDYDSRYDHESGQTVATDAPYARDGICHALPISIKQSLIAVVARRFDVKVAVAAARLDR
jgi:hypothetical protein